MPKLTAPLLSMAASGSLGKTMVFSKWKGVAYARQHVIPANPRTMKQTNNRAIWATLNTAWLYAPTAVMAAFNAFAIGKPLTGRNKFFSDNQSLLGGDPVAANMTGFAMSPGANGGLPPTGLVVAPGDTQLIISATVPGVPDGWTLTKAVAAAIVNQNPTDPFSGEWFTAEALVDPYTVTITGLANGTEYAVGYWLVWSRADGKTAYSVSLASTGTPTV